MKNIYHIILITITILLVLFIEIIFVQNFDYPVPNVTDLEQDSVLIEKEIPTLYGIPIEGYNIEHYIIKRNQSLSNLLVKYHISPLQIDSLQNKSKGIFDLRKMRAGNKYLLFQSQDSLSKLNYLVYEHSSTDYIIFDFKDSINVELHQKEITIIKRKSSGIIQSSLWKAMIDNDINPILANELSEIYAWTIDFFGLQKGDAFTVLYDEQFVDSVSIGIDNIYGAIFTHYGKDFLAINYNQDSIMSYYDERGQSLRRSFLKAPLRFKRISSRFSYSRLHPILKIRRPHLGIDYAAPIGTPVHSVGDGQIVEMKYKKQAGRIMKIKHNSVYKTGYLHLSKFAKGLKVGSFVKQGQVIGYVGSTGLSTGPHLDFRFWRNKQPVDPLKVEAPPVEGIKDSNKISFNYIKDSIFNILSDTTNI